MVNTTIQDVIRQWQVYFAALPGIRKADEYLPDGKPEPPFIVCYSAGGVWKIGPDGPDYENRTAMKEARHSLTIELHCSFASLADANEVAMRYVDLIPHTLIQKYLWDTRWNSTVEFPDGLTVTQDRPGSMGWAGQDTWGIRWRVDGVVMRSAVPA